VSMAGDREAVSTDVAAPWRRARTEASYVSLIVLGLFYYWFAVADRYAVFLYGHSAPGLDVAQPFDEATSSRYWMAGLVAAGIVMIVYVAVQGLLGMLARRRKQEHAPAEWQRVWLLSAVAIVPGVLVITMTMNAPALPLHLALACVVTVMLGLALALIPGRVAAQSPLDLAWLAADGLGLLPPLLLLHAIEYAGGASGMSAYIRLVVAASILAGMLWLVAMSLLRRWRRTKTPAAAAVLLAGLALSYLLMPVVHYVFFTPAEYRYITVAGNFFASSPVLQTLALLLAAALAAGVTALRRRMAAGAASANDSAA